MRHWRLAVGYECHPSFIRSVTDANRQVLSVEGQTPTVALVANRYKEMSNFKPEQYWELKTVYRDTTFASTKDRFSSKRKVRISLTSVPNADFMLLTLPPRREQIISRLFDLTLAVGMQ